MVHIEYLNSYFMVYQLRSEALHIIINCKMKQKLNIKFPNIQKKQCVKKLPSYLPKYMCETKNVEKV